MLFHFSIGAENFQTLRKTSPKKIFCFSYFVCRGNFFQRFSVILGLSLNLRGFGRNDSTVFSQVHWRSAEEHSSCLFLKKVLISSDSEQIFPAVWVEKAWHWSQWFRILMQMNNLASFAIWNVFLIMYFEQETFRL